MHCLFSQLSIFYRWSMYLIVTYGTVRMRYKISFKNKYSWSTLKIFLLKTSFLTKATEPSLSNHLPITWRRRRERFMSFPRKLMRNVALTAKSSMLIQVISLRFFYRKPLNQVVWNKKKVITSNERASYILNFRIISFLGAILNNYEMETCS